MPKLSFALLLIGTASVAAQVSVDASGAGGSAATAMFAESIVGDATSFGAVSVSATPGLPRGIRLVASATYGPGDGQGYAGRMAALGVGAEAPLSGGRNGVYLALGGAFLDFDNGDPSGCLLDPNCMDETGSTPSHAGLAAAVGVGARIPVARRLWIEPSVSAFVWEALLPSARLGVGWRVR